AGSPEGVAAIDDKLAAIDGKLAATHRRHAAQHAAQALCELVIHASHSHDRKTLVEQGVLQPLLSFAAPPATQEALALALDASSDASLALDASAEVDKIAWQHELRVLAARALLQLTSAPSALRQVRESEEHRARMLQEPSLLQALVSLTALDADTDALEEAETVEWRSAELVRESELKAEVKKHAMLTILQLSTTSSHAQLFLQLLPAMPLVRLAGIGGAELQYACARLLFLLARPASGCARSSQLAEAAAQPLVKLCAVAHIKVQYAAAQAVERLAQHTEHGRHVLFDAGVLPPL
ncbi:hypothetical protein Ctob_016735, partial [Chrysochromulina tobinii]